MGNGKKSTYACNRQREQLQGMRLTNNENSTMKTQKQSAIDKWFSKWYAQHVSPHSPLWRGIGGEPVFYFSQHFANPHLCTTFAKNIK